MLPSKYRISAFTILELTIVMLISAIVIGITYTAYSIISHTYLNFTTKNADMEVLIRVDELLKTDFSKCDAVTLYKDELIFNDAANSIKYQFNPEYVVRNLTDTFKIKTTGLNAIFEHKQISQNDTYTDNPQLIDEFSVHMLFHTDTIPYHYSKTYSSQNLIIATSNAIN